MTAIPSTAGTGVYGIFCTASRKWYIGSTSVSFKHRWKMHKRNLKRGDHHSQKLQRAWVKYGEHAFEFKILEITRPEWCIAVEQAFLDSWKTVKRGYNVAPIAGSRRGYKHTSETIKKMSAAAKGRTFSDETRAKMSEAKRCLSPESRAKIGATTRGRIHSVETRRRMSAAAKGKAKSIEHSKKIGEANRRRVVSAETIEKLRAANIGKTHSVKTRAKMSASQKRRHAQKLDIAIN